MSLQAHQHWGPLPRGVDFSFLLPFHLHVDGVPAGSCSSGDHCLQVYSFFFSILPHCVFGVPLQAHAALGSRLQEEQSTSAQLNEQIQDGQAAAAKLQRTISDLEQQVSSL